MVFVCPAEPGMRLFYLIGAVLLLTSLGLLGYASTQADSRAPYSIVR